ncbi:MAG TPA: hypothetical protein PLQ78_01560 [Flavipsychrobacter sp.]|jgi:hypothetical protein|nr:hypothetical protein [Flavipsychrobacter sp.]
MNDLHLIQYNTTLSKDELAFLKQKEKKDRKQLYLVANVLMVFCFACPFAGSWILALDGETTEFSLTNYFIGVIFLLLLSTFALYWTYKKYLYKVQQDIHHASKIIKAAIITRKQYMPENNKYYFYLTNAIKLSIEVTDQDYRKWEVGEEIQIETTPYSKQYLGYH